MHWMPKHTATAKMAAATPMRWAVVLLVLVVAGVALAGAASAWADTKKPGDFTSPFVRITPESFKPKPFDPERVQRESRQIQEKLRSGTSRHTSSTGNR